MSEDEHIIKLAYSSWQEDMHYHKPFYQQAATILFMDR